jgi:hypothetical protein
MDLKELISTLERIYFQEGNLECTREYFVSTIETISDGQLKIFLDIK